MSAFFWLVSSAIAAAPPLHPGPDSAYVTFTSGGGEATIAGAPTALSIGLEMPPGTLVCTAPGGFATVRLAVESVGTKHDEISLLGGTCLTIVAASATAAGRQSIVSVQQGSVAVRETSDTTSSVSIRTEAGETAGDNGGFRVTVEADKSARTEALTSPVEVSAQGVVLPVSAGQGSRTKLGEAPGAAVDLLLPGVPQFPMADAALRRADFTWTAVPRALGYRIELSATADFSQLVLVDDVSDPGYAPERMFLPYSAASVWWRVASFDRTGFLGVPSESRRATFPAGVGP